MLGFDAKIDGPSAKRTLPFAPPFRVRFTARKGRHCDPATLKSVSVRKDPDPLFSITYVRF